MLKQVVWLLPILFSASKLYAQSISDLAKTTAQYAVNTYQHDMVTSLAALLQHNTVAIEGVPSDKNPVHIAFKGELQKQAKTLGFDYTDHGYIVVIGLGNSKERLGIITHGDVQPANETKWQKSPFELDLTSEPGKLIGRGTEDDKGPISTALYAMKAIKDKNLQLNKRIELYVYMAEESDWGPLEAFVKNNELPQTNITIDADYPVVIAEKGYGTISMTFPNKQVITNQPYLSAFTGGAFASQIPEDATVLIENAGFDLLTLLMDRAKSYKNVGFDFNLKKDQLSISATGKSAHSSTPENGVNAITYLADLLNINLWPNTASGALVNFINDHIGIDLYGKKFGDIAYSDNFMGPMTVAPTVLKQLDNAIKLNINIRRPKGKSALRLEDEINFTLKKWQQINSYQLSSINNEISDPFVQINAPHIKTLLSVYSHFTGEKDPQPVSIGGGTNSRLFPNAVSFGPSMPNVEYTGHSEHEFITMKQFILNLEMYTAVMVELSQ